MAELFVGRPLFPGKNSIDQLAKIVKVLGSPQPDELRAMGQNTRKTAVGGDSTKMTPKRSLQEYLESLADVHRTLPKEAVELLTEMLRYDPSKRISAAQALYHSFFTQLGSVSKRSGASNGLGAAPQPSSSLLNGNKTSLQPS